MPTSGSFRPGSGRPFGISARIVCHISDNMVLSIRTSTTGTVLWFFCRRTHCQLASKHPDVPEENTVSKPLSAGSLIVTRCTRCKAELNHTIVAMVGEKIVRVECDTCHGTHAYHPPKAVKAPAAARTPGTKTATPRAPRVDPEAAARREWAALEPAMDPERAVPYDMARVYRVNTLLSHPHFGLGIVQAVLPPNKISVLFKDSKKLLRCG